MSTTRITDNDYADVALYDKVNTIANEIDNEVSKKANSSNTVTTDTTQTINARKTFNQRLDVKGDIIRSIDIDPSTTPTSNIYLVPWVVDNSNQSVRAYQQVAYFTSGVLQNTLGLRRTVNGTNIFNGIDLKIDANGNISSSLQNLTTTRLTFTDHLYKNTGVDSKVNPSTYREVTLLDAKDTNGILNSSIRTGYRADGTIDTLFYTGKDGTNKAFAVRMTSDGRCTMLGQTPLDSAKGVEMPTAAWVRNQLSSSGHALATFSKGTNGYYKFTNGLTIQWGSYEQTGNNSVTFPTAFSSTNYTISICGLQDVASSSTGANISDNAIRSKTTTGFISNHLNRNRTNMYLAIGY